MTNELFLSIGDFIFPFSYADFFQRHFYLWSENSSALSLDGVIRLLIKSPFISFFYLTDSPLLSGYFYILFIFCFSSVSIYFFLRKFLNLNHPSSLLGMLLFLFNPAFLGNYAKIGLILSVAMLPLILIFLKKLLTEKSFSNVIIIAFLLNFSLLHPYNFLVNFLISVSYVLYKYKMWIRNFKMIVKLFFVPVFFVFISFYFLLPIVTLKTLSKDSIQNKFTRGDETVDYTSLVDVANTGGYVNGFAMSKDVFLDFDFFNKKTELLFYFSSIFILILIFWIFFFFQTRKREEKKHFLFFLIPLIILIPLSVVGSEKVSSIIKYFIENLPAGWAFRSPLKWQLYIPIFLSSLLALSLNNVSRYKKVIFGSFVLLIIFSNSYLLFDIYKKLLKPKNLGEYENFYQEIKNANNVLFIRNTECLADIASKDLAILNQVLNSVSGAVYFIDYRIVNLVPIDSFSHIISCKKASIKIEDSFENKVENENFVLYQNIFSNLNIKTFSDLFSIDSGDDVEKKVDFIKDNFSRDKVYFIDNKRSKNIYGQIEIMNVFENISFDWFDDNKIYNKEVITDRNGHFLKKDIEDGNVEQLNYSERMLVYPFPTEKKDLIENGSFEFGSWQKEVNDCYNYDKNSIISMIESDDSNGGLNSLELSSVRHVACVNQDFKIETSDKKYLFSLSYKANDKNIAGYNLNFYNDQKEKLGEFLDRFQLNTNSWNDYKKIINIPDDAVYARLHIYAFEPSFRVDKSIVKYDNISLISLPDDILDYWYFNESTENFVDPASIEFDLLNPTKKLVHIKGATTPFYLAMSESYHPQWQAQLNNEKINGFFKGWVPWVKPDRISDDKHFELDGFLNGWFVEPETLCANDNKACIKNADGSYDMELTIEFYPQRWFYLGLLISGTTFVGCITYLLVDFIRRRRKTIS